MSDFNANVYFRDHAHVHVRHHCAHVLLRFRAHDHVRAYVHVHCLSPRPSHRHLPLRLSHLGLEVSRPPRASHPHRHHWAGHAMQGAHIHERTLPGDTRSWAPLTH